MTNPFLFFLRCLILSAFGYKKERLVIFDLFTKFSYRYTYTELSTFLSPLRYLRVSFILLFKNSILKPQESVSSFVYDGKLNSFEVRKEYLENINYKNSIFVFRDSLTNNLNLFERLVNSCLLLFVFCLVMPIALLRKDKAKPSLILLELTEALLLTKILTIGKCNELLICSASEKDILFLSYFSGKKMNISVSILPSANPITFYYQHVICDTFIFTAPFQKNEYESLKKNWFIKNKVEWPLFGFNSICINKEPTKIKKPYVIGIMSSGMALRQQLAHTNSLGNMDFLAETSMITAIKKIRDETNIIDRLIIYLHPLEKLTEENLNFSYTYYRNIFPDVEFAPLDRPSKSCFDLCSVAVSGFSSSQMERLFGGYKTIFAPMGFLQNYFADKRLNHISVQNYQELKLLLEDFRSMNDTTFFDKFNLKQYRWDSYREYPI